jgi:hypothetical protein
VTERGIRRFFGSILAAVIVIGMMSSPASADTVTIDALSGLESAEGVDVAGFFSPAGHAGTVKITLSRKRPDGTWKKIATKPAAVGFPNPGSFIAFFNKVTGKKTCRAKAVFTSPEHAPATKRTQFPC